jgi:hypothetical protein
VQVLRAAGVVDVVVVHVVLDDPFVHVFVLVAKTVLDNEGASTSVAAATTMTIANIVFVWEIIKLTRTMYYKKILGYFCYIFTNT